MAKIGLFASVVILIFTLNLQKGNSSFVCESLPKVTRRSNSVNRSDTIVIPTSSLSKPYYDDGVEVETRRGLLKNLVKGAVTAGSLSALGVLDLGFTTAKHLVLKTHQAVISVVDFPRNFANAILDLNSLPQITNFEKVLFASTRPRGQCLEIGLLERINDITGLNIHYDNLTTTYKQLVELKDSDLHGLLLIQSEVNPLTIEGFFEYIRWMIKTNNIRLAFVIRFTQKIFGLLSLPYQVFRDNFKAVINSLLPPSQIHEHSSMRDTHLGFHLRRPGKWVLNMQKLPRPLRLQHVEIGYLVVGKLTCLNVLNQFATFLIRAKVAIIRTFVKAGINLVFNTISIFSNIHDLFTGAVHALTTIIKWMIATKIHSLEMFLHHLRLIFEGSATGEIRHPFLEFVRLMFNLPKSHIGLLEIIIRALLNDPKNTNPVIEIPSEVIIAKPKVVEIMAVVVPPKVKTDDEIRELYTQLWIRFMEQLVDCKTESSDFFVLRLRKALSLPSDAVKSALMQLRNSYPKRFNNIIEWLRSSSDLDNPDFKLFLKKFKVIISDNLDLRFLMVELARHGGNNQEIIRIQGFLEQFIQELSNEERFDNIFLVKLKEHLRLEGKVSNLEAIRGRGNHALNLFLSEILMLEITDSMEFEKALQHVIITRSLAAQFFFKILYSVFNIQGSQPQIVSVMNKLQNELLALSNRPKEEIEAFKVLVVLLRMIFCQASDNSKLNSVLLTNIRDVFVKNKRVEFHVPLRNLVQLFEEKDPKLTALLEWIEAENNKSDQFGLIEKLETKIEAGETTVLASLLASFKAIFELKYLDIVDTEYQLTEAIQTRNYHIFEVRLSTVVASADSILTDLFQQKNSHFQMTLRYLERLFNRKISQQRMVEKLKEYNDNHFESYIVVGKWFEKFNGGGINQKIVMALINLRETYDQDQNSTVLSEIALFLRDLFGLTDLSKVEFKQLFLRAVSGIVVKRVEVEGGQEVTVTFKIVTVTE